MLVGGGHGSGWLLPIRGGTSTTALTESEWVHCGCAAMVRFQAMGLREECLDRSRSSTSLFCRILFPSGAGERGADGCW